MLEALSRGVPETAIGREAALLLDTLAQIARLGGEVDEREQRLRGLIAEIERLTAALEERDGRLTKTAQEMGALRQRAGRLRGEIAARDEEIEQLADALRRLKEIDLRRRD